MKSQGRRYFFYLFLAGWVFPALAVGQGPEALPLVRIGFVLDGPWEGNREIRALFERETAELLEGEFDVRFPEDKRLVDGWTAPGVRDALSRLLADPEVDIVIALGVLASNCACLRGDLPKPVLAPVVLDADLQGLPQKGGASGVKNLSYTAFPNPIRRHLEVFQQVAPFRKLALLTTHYYMEGLQEIRTRFPAVTGEMGISLQIIPVGQSAGQALEQIEPDVEAVYLTPLLHMSTEEFDRLVRGLIERRLPSFSLLGRSEVERGVFAGLNAEDTFSRLARRVALNVQRILLGEDPGRLPFAFPPRERLSINMATARAIRVWPSFRVLAEAELLHEDIVDVERRISLFEAVEQAIAANLDLAARQRAVAAGAQEVSKARASLLPRVEVSGLGRVLDEDRARAAFGSEAERKLTAQASLSQVLFSEPAWANLAVQRHLQTAREEELEQLRLDVAFETAVTYLNLLRAKTFERIEKENLKLTRSNLELAQVRQSVGIAGPAEVYRWESELATGRQSVLHAVSQREQAEQALNRLLHRPLAESLVTEEVDLGDPRLSTGDRRVEKFVSNPWTLDAFREFLVSEGLAASVELKGLDAAVAAQERQFRSARRAYWTPALGLQGEVSRILAEGGAGTGSPAIPGFGSGLVPEADDTNWSVGVQASLPLFEGGARSAEEKRAVEELNRLRIQRAATRERIEQRIQSALLETQASSPSIGLSRDAAAAARKNLELVTDAYSRGVVSILELLDAQNATLVSEQVAASAVYDFLVDMMDVQRATNRFDFFMTPEARDAWLGRLEMFIEDKKASGQ